MHLYSQQTVQQYRNNKKKKVLLLLVVLVVTIGVIETVHYFYRAAWNAVAV